jgi:hypothetical protein
MEIRIVNFRGDKIALSPPVKTALDSLGLEAEKPDINYEELSHKIVRVLEGDGLDLSKLQPEIKYSESKKGKKIQSIKVYYTG